MSAPEKQLIFKSNRKWLGAHYGIAAKNNNIGKTKFEAVARKKS